MARRTSREPSWSALNPFPPFIDIAVATIVILLLLSVLQALRAMSVDVHAEIARRQEALRASVAQTLPDRWGRSVYAHTDGDEQLFRFSDEILFPTSEATLDPRGIQVLQLFGRALRQHEQTYKSVRVEGHTDERPFIRPPLKSNWDLSVMRATAVVRVLTDPEFGVGLDPARVTAAGYGQYHPLPEGRGHDERSWRLNRRIEVAVRYSQDDVRSELDSARRAHSGNADATP